MQRSWKYTHVVFSRGLFSWPLCYLSILVYWKRLPSIFKICASCKLFFTSCWLAHNQRSRNALLFSRNPIGQLCLGGPDYSSRTAKCPCIQHVRYNWGYFSFVSFRRQNRRRGSNPWPLALPSSFWAIPHLFERLFLISWENYRYCHITMPLSQETMEVQIKGGQWNTSLERCRSTASFAFTGF